MCRNQLSDSSPLRSFLECFRGQQEGHTNYNFELSAGMPQAQLDEGASHGRKQTCHALLPRQQPASSEAQLSFANVHHARAKYAVWSLELAASLLGASGRLFQAILKFSFTGRHRGIAASRHREGCNGNGTLSFAFGHETLQNYGFTASTESYDCTHIHYQSYSVIMLIVHVRRVEGFGSDLPCDCFLGNEKRVDHVARAPPKPNQVLTRSTLHIALLKKSWQSQLHPFRTVAKCQDGFESRVASLFSLLSSLSSLSGLTSQLQFHHGMLSSSRRLKLRCGSARAGRSTRARMLSVRAACSRDFESTNGCQHLESFVPHSCKRSLDTWTGHQAPLFAGLW